MTTPGSVGADDPLRQAQDWLSARGVEVTVGETVDEVEPSSRQHRPVSRQQWPKSGGQTAGIGRIGQRPPDLAKPHRQLETEAGSEAEADPEAVARAIVVRKLAAQDRTRAELADALRRRLVPEEVADQVLDQFEQAALVDDAAFAQRWVDSRQQRRHLSSSALRRELTAKGVDRDQVDAALATVDPEDELAAAFALARKKAATMSGLGRDIRYRRLSAALARRGFNIAVIARVLAEIADD